MAAEKAAGSALRKPFSRVVSGAIGDFANRVGAYLDRNEGSNRWRHRAGVPAGRVAWYGLRYFADPIEELRNELERSLGFKWLTPEDIDEDEIDLEACWRRPFKLAEVAEGYAIDRERPSDDGERENVTDTLFEELRGGDQRVVLGRPGSGKSTICKSVACRWYESRDVGPVLYRKSGQGIVGEQFGLFDTAVERAKARGPVLVVVEDAARRDAVRVLEAVDEYADDSKVSFLLDSRTSEWESGDETALETGEFGLRDDEGKTIRSLFDGEIPRRHVPRLDEREVERVADRFQEKTGKTVGESPERILERIRGDGAGGDGMVQSGRESGAWLSPMLLVAYHLPAGSVAVDPEATDAEGTETALHMNVREVYNAIHNPELASHDVDADGREELLERLVVLANVLNAAELGVPRELVHALATTDSDHDAVRDLLTELKGTAHFGLDDSDDTYWSHHQLWSMLYLELLLDDFGEQGARTLFEESVNALFEFVDDIERREVFQEWLGRPVGRLAQFEESREQTADVIVRVVFDIGNKRPKLTPLYGTTEYSELKVPDTCSDETGTRCALWRAKMYRVHGEPRQAVTELEEFHEMGSQLDVDSDWVNATYYLIRGNVALASGNFEIAREYYQQSREIEREVGDRAGEANSLGNLGVVAQSQGDYEAAREFLEQSLEIFREVGDRAGEANSLEGLGLVARNQGDYEAAQEYHEQSLEIKREVGDRAGEAKSLGNLASVLLEQGDYEAAREYHEQSLEIKREVGDRAGEPTSLGNLGVVAQSQGDYEAARNYFEQALEIEREVGDRAGEATSFNNLGLVASNQGDLESAREYYEQAADLFREIGAISRCLTAYDNLVEVAISMNDPGGGIKYAHEALAVIDQTDIPGLEDDRRTFESYLETLDALRGDVRDVYHEALESVLENKGGTAFQLFHNGWERRNDAGDEEHHITLSAGVGVAAHVELFDDESAEDVRAILEDIGAERDHLSDPVQAVFDYLADGDVDQSPAELLEAAAPDLTDADDVAMDDLSLDELEALAFARLLEVLTGSGAESPEEQILAGYAQALTHILQNESGDAMQTLYTVWERRDIVDEDSEPFSATLAAGVGFAAHTVFLDDPQADEDRKETLEEIAQHEDRLFQPELALYEYLTEGETETSPEELREEVDEDTEEMDLNDMENLAYAGLLEALQRRDEEE